MDTQAPSAALRAQLPLLLMSAIAAQSPLAVDMYLPAIPQLASDLGARIATVQNSLSVFLLGFGLGMLVWGPASDRHGRRPFALFGQAGFTLTALLLMFSTSPAMFLGLRFLQGFLGSAATVVIPAIIRDCYGKDTAKGMSAVSMVMLLAPLLAPTLGSLMLALAPWQGIFGLLALYSGALFVLTLRRMPETRPPSAMPRSSMLANYRIILGQPRIYFDLLTYMFAALAFFTYLTSVSFVYITYFGVSEKLFGFLFACSASALILANYINVRVVSRFGSRRVMHVGLAVGIVFALLFLLLTRLHPSLPLTVALFACVVGCLGLSWVNVDALIIVEFPHQASSASAVNGTMRFGFGALAGPLLAWLYDGTPLPVAGLLFASMLGAGAMQVLRRLVLKRAG